MPHDGGEQASSATRAPVEDVRERPPERKRMMPWDTQVLGWFRAATGGVVFAFGSLLLAGIARRPDEAEPFPVLFGLVFLESGQAMGLYYVVLGICGAVCGWGLIRGRSWGWWLGMAGAANGVATSAFTLKRFGSVGIVGISMGGAFILWLMFRARIYSPFGQGHCTSEGGSPQPARVQRSVGDAQDPQC